MQRTIFHFGFWMAVATVGLLSGCSGTSNQSGSYYCTISGVTVASSSNQVSFTLSAYNGEPNYSISSIAMSGTSGTVVSGSSSFSSSTSLTTQFGSLTYSSLLGASGTVTITDSESNTASCSLYIPSSTSSNGLACTMTPSSSSVATYTNDTLTITGSGGSGSYTFSNFAPGSNVSYNGGLTTLSTTQAQATVAYSTAGTYSPSVQITDANGNTASCYTSITVGSGGSSSGSLSCSAFINPNPSYVGNYVSAYATSSNSNVYISNINYPLASNLSGYFTGSMSAYLYFPVRGSWNLTFIIKDYSGNTGSCNVTQTVY